MRGPSLRKRAAQSITVAALTALVSIALPTAAGAANPWTRLVVPSPAAREQQLAAVSCVSATDCTAVGYFVYPSGGKTTDRAHHRWDHVDPRVQQPDSGK
jgi:hypothetical protein